MVTPIDEPEEDVQEEEVIAEVSIPSTSKSKDKSKFDFAVESTDRLGLVVYTVSTKPPNEGWKTLTILAPHYGAALEIAGLGKGNTIKVSEAPFEG
jgi:hypothetical protein